MIDSTLFWAGLVLAGAVAGRLLLHWRAQALAWPRPPIYTAVLVGQTIFLIWSLLRLLAFWLIPPLLAGGCLQIVDGALGIFGFLCSILIVGGIGFPPAARGLFRPRPGHDLRERPGHRLQRGERPRPGAAPRWTGSAPLPQDGAPWSMPGRRPRARRRRGRPGPS